MEELIIKAVEDLDEDKVIKLANEALNDGMEPFYLLDLIKEGMNRVGKLYENKQYFIADLIMAGLIFKEVLKLDKMIAQFHNNNAKKIGKLLVGTVKGDLHDIGKDIFRGMMEANSFDVIDLGVDVPVESFVQGVVKYDPDIIGLSGVLNFTIETMKNTVDALRKAGLKDNRLVILGGNHLTKEACEYIGADFFTNDASIGVKYCKQWIKEKCQTRGHEHGVANLS
ncbi:MAG TPA: cobalamin-binding protein [Thermoanaerobacterales bacterium]|uniref:cobalamin B12-binding domain-containing protein n=1 Tax=Tepidanaerobacter sp. GT38 TaxID=2722793 RepID=UPI00180A0DA7|nr:cobalamin-dependent protein [Tepidanaerobacter sp. GT38]MCG1012605.1 cobalamin-dependent protein [Tepidanaerobacter sp. GT38]HHY42440.1 cobalamin-binding protein [Thermoanaerobacterales bacterium]